MEGQQFLQDDNEQTAEVKKMFDEIEEALFEDKPLKNQQLKKECREWAARFPYLRVIGLAILPSFLPRIVTTNQMDNLPDLVQEVQRKLEIPRLSVRNHP
uniref:DUF3719 domain-containing protein n=1 Tax=Romanomermis culicivorax TaxID=13658 RepID=A0A915IFU8_ROMCU